MKLPSSPETNKKQNAIVVLLRQSDPGADTGHPLSGVLSPDELRAFRTAIVKDIEGKMRLWSDFATCFIAVDKLDDWAEIIDDHYDSLELSDTGSVREKLNGVLEWLWEEEFRRILFVDGYSPSLPMSLARDAFEWLWEKDVVLGPNLHGGCYMIGMRDLEGKIIPHTGYSHSRSFAEIVASVRDANLSLQLLEFWNTVAQPADLVHLYYHLAAFSVAQGNSTSFEGASTWVELNNITGGQPLPNDPRFRNLLDQPAQPVTAGSNSSASGRRPMAGVAPAPLPSEVARHRRPSNRWPSANGPKAAPKLPDSNSNSDSDSTEN